MTLIFGRIRSPALISIANAFGLVSGISWLDSYQPAALKASAAAAGSNPATFVPCLKLILINFQESA